MVGIVAAIAVFYGIVHVLNYMYVDPESSSGERLIWHEFYENKGRIDNVYLGSSHVHNDLNPMHLDDINHQFNFNLSTPGQLPNGTFHLLREADRYNNLSHVYVELYYYFYVQADMESDHERMSTEFFRTWNNSDYMKFSANKLVYMFSMARPEQYTDLCIPFTRYRTKLADWDYIKRVMDAKQQEEYMEYKWHSGTVEYIGKGYFSDTQPFEDCNKIYAQTDVIGDNPIGETAEKYLRKTIEYCRKREIPITLFITPIYELQLISTENYDNYVDQVRRIADEYGVEFYDFNLTKGTYLPIQNRKYFRDFGHLNKDGSDMFTPFFYEVVSGERSDNEKYFYDSYAEKLQNAEPEIYGIYYRTSKNKICRVAANRNSGMEYRIVMTPDEGAQYVIQDFDENQEFTIPRGETGICTIVARMKESPDEVQTLEIKY